TPAPAFRSGGSRQTVGPKASHRPADLMHVRRGRAVGLHRADDLDAHLVGAILVVVLAGAGDGPLVAVAVDDRILRVVVVDLDVHVGGVDVQRLEHRGAVRVVDVDVDLAGVGIVGADLDGEVIVVVVVHRAAHRGELAVDVVAADLHHGGLLAQRGLGGRGGGVAVRGRGGVVAVARNGLRHLRLGGGGGDDRGVLVVGARRQGQSQGRDGEEGGGAVAQVHGRLPF